MYSDEELLPVSALQHLVFCERQWALIHLEQVWAENALTVKGEILHERVHETDHEQRGDLIIARSVAIKSSRLGLVGKADVIEFIPVDEADERFGIRLDGKSGLWRPVPVEYKHGKPKVDRSDEIQLCAQAICLEEMLGISIEYGELYYGRPRRRSTVVFDRALRDATEEAARRLHELTWLEQTPRAVYKKACNSCSLYEYCLPAACNGEKSVLTYIEETFYDLESEDVPE